MSFFVQNNHFGLAVSLKMFFFYSETINGKEGTSSHLVTIPPGPHLSDALVSSPIVQVDR